MSEWFERNIVESFRGNHQAIYALIAVVMFLLVVAVFA